jgi:hypothetical protein
MVATTLLSHLGPLGGPVGAALGAGRIVAGQRFLGTQKAERRAAIGIGWGLAWLLFWAIAFATFRAQAIV